MTEWKDITSYSQGQVDRKPTILQYKTPHITLSIVWNHRNYPDEWVMNCFDIRMEQERLNLDSYDEIDYAKEKAIELVDKKLNKMIFSL
jgi:hypothetical protein